MSQGLASDWALFRPSAEVEEVPKHYPRLIMHISVWVWSTTNFTIDGTKSPPLFFCVTWFILWNSEKTNYAYVQCWVDTPLLAVWYLGISRTDFTCLSVLKAWVRIIAIFPSRRAFGGSVNFHGSSCAQNLLIGVSDCRLSKFHMWHCQPKTHAYGLI